MLKGDESALIREAVAGGTLGEIAAVAGVSVSTVQRRLRDSDVLGEIAAARAQQRREVSGRLGGESAAAVERLKELVSHKDPGIALRAINMTLSNVDRFARLVEAEERLAPEGLADVGDLA